MAARPELSQEYETVADELSGLAGDSILGVFHIGSTSVPGLAAKDVIDVQVSVESESLIDQRLTYSDLKDPVCDLVYLPARQWAVETGWLEPQ